MSAFERELMEQVLKRELPAWATHAAVCLSSGETLPAALHPLSKRMISADPAEPYTAGDVSKFATGRWKFILLRGAADVPQSAEAVAAMAALHKMACFIRNMSHPGDRDMQYLEIVLAGLGYTWPQIKAEVIAVIQAKRDRDAARRAELQGGSHEAS